MMKMKLALFMFALGLGSSYAYAAGSPSSCQSWCYTSYNNCIKHTYPDICRDMKEDCLAGCGARLP